MKNTFVPPPATHQSKKLSRYRNQHLTQISTDGPHKILNLSFPVNSPHQRRSRNAEGMISSLTTDLKDSDPKPISRVSSHTGSPSPSPMQIKPMFKFKPITLQAILPEKTPILSKTVDAATKTELQVELPVHKFPPVEMQNFSVSSSAAEPRTRVVTVRQQTAAGRQHNVQSPPSIIINQLKINTRVTTRLTHRQMQVFTP